jgi:hypothetical protein
MRKQSSSIFQAAEIERPMKIQEAILKAMDECIPELALSACRLIEKFQARPRGQV